jgi:CMP-N,N'-diacetyllegionaminic acid synthase
MKIYAILTGRGGSKLKNKNILKINGKPCLQYPCDAAKQVRVIDKFYSSSDDKNILKLTTKLGYEKIKRPKNLSRDTTKHIDVIKHALNFIKKREKIIPEIIIVLLANAPIIKSKWISECLGYLKKDKSITAVVPVVEDNDHHPLRAKKTKNGFLKEFIKSKSNISSNRQALEKNYFLCHNFWVIRTKEIYKNNGGQPWTFMGTKVKPYLIKNSIDIHEQQDIIIANYLIKNNK